MTDLLHSPLSELTEMLTRKQLGAVELMKATLDRIRDTHERINAFVALRDPELVLAESREAERRIAAGEARPLEGIRSASRISRT